MIILKHLPDLNISSSFWASIATMWAASGAWFTFFFTVKTAKEQNHDSTVSLLSGLEAEMELISGWASGAEGEQGYSQNITTEKLIQDHQDWFNPSRQIYSFDAPSLQNFTTTTDLRRFAEIVQPLVALNHSIRRLFDLNHELRTYVHSHLSLYDSVSEKFSHTTRVWTHQEQVYINIIFGFNRKIHQQVIGGADSTDGSCLYKTFREAKRAVAEFKTRLHPEAFPKWYLILHAVAAYFAVYGLWQVFRWWYGT